MITDQSTRSAAGLLTLTAFKGIGPQTALRLAEKFSTLDALQGADDDALSGISARVVTTLRSQDEWLSAQQIARHQLEAAADAKVQVIGLFDPGYPRLLAQIGDAPVVIFAKGSLRVDVCPVACVGTREPSSFGVTVSKRITQHLCQAGCGIVSGLALGVDTLCHEAALEHSGYTVAVLANGLDTVYPKANESLAQRILDEGGALISEQPVGTPLIGRNLVKRDRIQSGLAVGTVVMQTDIEGGTMHTTCYTLMQHRLLFAPVPTGTHAQEPKSQGILAMTQEKGPEFAGRIKAQSEYMALLTKEFARRPPAIPIRGVDDYPGIVQRLKENWMQPPATPSSGMLFDLG